MVKFELIGADTIVSTVQAWNPKIEKELTQSVGRMVLRLHSHVRGNKLSGQVLKVRTGNLRNSVHKNVSRRGNAVVGTVGTNVRYGIAHEYGFSGSVNVRAHLRQVKQAFGRPLKTAKVVYVRPSVRKVNLPERSFLRTALKDLQPAIQNELRAAAERAMR